MYGCMYACMYVYVCTYVYENNIDNIKLGKEIKQLSLIKNLMIIISLEGKI